MHFGSKTQNVNIQKKQKNPTVLLGKIPSNIGLGRVTSMDHKTCYRCHREDVPYLAELCPFCQAPYVGRPLRWCVNLVNSKNIARRSAGVVVGIWATGTAITLLVLCVVTGAIAYFSPDFKAWLLTTAKNLVK